MTPEQMADAFMEWLKQEEIADVRDGETRFRLTEAEVQLLSEAFMAGVIYGIKIT